MPAWKSWVLLSDGDLTNDVVAVWVPVKLRAATTLLLTDCSTSLCIEMEAMTCSSVAIQEVVL